jgi:hypothetical protein
MSTELEVIEMDSLNINPHGVSHQAIAVLAYLDQPDGIEGSWNDERSRYNADLRSFPVYNCRERGYAVIDTNTGLTAIFCEHRNTDNIVVSMFKSPSKYGPVSFDDFIDTLPASADKWSMWDQSFGWLEAGQAAQWILEQFENSYKD